MNRSFRLVLSRIVFLCLLTAAFGPLSALAQDYDTYGTADAGDQPAYPGIPPKNKVEGTLGDYTLRVYGTALLNIHASDGTNIGGEVPLWASPSSGRTTFIDGSSERSSDVHDLIFTARQSILGFMVKPSSTTDKWKTSAKVEFDFFGTRPVDGQLPNGRVLNQPRLRFAYFQFGQNNWKITAGQDKAILAPLDPVSLSHVAVPLGDTAGNLWAWLPQVRFDATRKAGSTSLLFQAGVLRPQFADPRLPDAPAVGTSLDGNPGFGERATQPFYESRLALSHGLNGSNATVGFSGHYGRERLGVNRTIDSWAFALDYAVPLHKRLTWRGENFVGSNLVAFGGGVLQGVSFFQPVATAPPVRFNRVGAGGGWTELIIKATSDSKNVFYLGVGKDDPRDRHLLPGSTRSRNEFAWASYFRKLSDAVTVALEWTNWQFATRTFTGPVASGHGPSGRSNVFNLAFAYQF